MPDCKWLENLNVTGDAYWTSPNVILPLTPSRMLSSARSRTPDDADEYIPHITGPLSSDTVIDRRDWLR